MILLSQPAARRVPPGVVVCLALTLFHQTVLAADHVVTLQPDGTFLTSDGTHQLHIAQGDTVTFTGLGQFDGIVRIDPTMGGLQSDVCSDLFPPYDLASGHEFTGPMRKAVSGLIALGPLSKDSSEPSGYREYGPFSSSGTNMCVNGVPRPAYEELDPSGDYWQLCRDNSPKFLDQIWDYEDVDSVTLRLNWLDVEPSNNSLDTSTLFATFDNAVRSGKSVSIDIRSGLWGMPDWAKAIVNVETFRYEPCFGHEMQLASPGNPIYRALYKDMISRVIQELKGSTAYWQALAHVKASGANSQTGESMLPRGCDQGTNCICNNEVWAGLFYTPDGLYEYFRQIEELIYTETDGQKSIGFQLIQAGWPEVDRITNANGVLEWHWVGDGCQNDNPPNDHSTDITSAIDQSVAILSSARSGEFAGGNSYEGKLFVPQHSGLQENPDDPISGHPLDHTCAGAKKPWWGHTVDSGSGEVTYPFAFWDFDLAIANGDLVSSGCPNKWITQEGWGGAVLGAWDGQGTWFQHETNSDANRPEYVESQLWNLTLNTDAFALELNEPAFWFAARVLGGGALDPVDPPNSDGNETCPGFDKSLSDWREELHIRRKYVADNANNEHLAYPFPEEYSFTFNKPIWETETHRFVSPRLCNDNSAGGDPHRVGAIHVWPEVVVEEYDNYADGTIDRIRRWAFDDDGNKRWEDTDSNADGVAEMKFTWYYIESNAAQDHLEIKKLYVVDGVLHQCIEIYDCGGLLETEECDDDNDGVWDRSYTHDYIWIDPSTVSHEIEDSSGNVRVTTHTRDANWNIVIEEISWNGSPVTRNEWTWDLASSPDRKVQWDHYAADQNLLLSTTYYDYDANGRLSQTREDQDGGVDGVIDEYATYEYDATGNLIKVEYSPDLVNITQRVTYSY